MNKWCQSLDDKVLNRELEVALWRTGRGSDGGRKMEFKFTGDEKRASDGTVNNILTSRTLQDMLRVTILKNKTAWQFSSTSRLKIASMFLIFLPFGMIPSFFRLARGRPFFGGGANGDGVEIAACVYAFLSSAMMFSFNFWQIFNSGGHLQRNLNIMLDWLKLLMPETSEADRGLVSSSGNAAANEACNSLALNGQNVRVWARGREALLQFGEVYWLRLSWMTAISAIEGGVLLLVLIMQLLMSLLGGVPIKFTPFMLMTAGWVLAFSFALSLVVWVGLRIILARSRMRTHLLRHARNILLSEVGADGSEKALPADRANLREAADEMRHLAYEHECEMESHKIRLLGLPLDTRMLESLFGGVLAIALVFYQSSASS